MHIRTLLVVTLAILAAGAMPAPAQQEDFGACAERSDLNAQIGACTVMIARSDLSDETRGGAYLYRCQAKDMLQKPGDALPDCREAARLRDWDPSVHNSLSIVHANLGQRSEAVAAAARAVALEPDNATFVNTRSNAYCAIGNVDASVDDRMRAMQLGRFSATTVQEWLSRSGHYRGAIDGIFGRGSRAALRAWTADGCP